ncbi:hypothetical protein FCULG_00012862 [Fusarium culmorum]|uniref:Uncharacterized protein n=1 Tax=Fusarium culmorum TaxID=5516 RepID=A0A2T4GFZ8_FUSCU|nr:hypothetical protein FCULG_00012862 [Fusarium culmorum]
MTSEDVVMASSWISTFQSNLPPSILSFSSLTSISAPAPSFILLELIAFVSLHFLTCYEVPTGSQPHEARTESVTVDGYVFAGVSPYRQARCIMVSCDWNKNVLRVEMSSASRCPPRRDVLRVEMSSASRCPPRRDVLRVEMSSASRCPPRRDVLRVEMSSASRCPPRRDVLRVEIWPHAMWPLYSRQRNIRVTKLLYAEGYLFKLWSTDRNKLYLRKTVAGLSLFDGRTW